MFSEKLPVAKSTESSLIDNLNSLMQYHKLHEASLARITNIPQPTLHKILTGKTADPRISTLKILADHFNTSIDELYVGNGKPGITQAKSETQSIPIISWEECIKGSGYFNILLPANWHQWLVVDMLDKRLYALTTKPCMELIFAIGTVLVIDTQKKPKDGDLVIVHYPNSQEATLRKLTIDGLNQLLAPINPHLSSDKITNEIKILGVVIQSRYTY